MTRAEVGLTVTHRRYVPYSHAHYAGNLVDGAYSLAAFGDVATEMCIRTDGDEGLFASYSDVQFRAPVRAGDVIEIEAPAGPGRDAAAARWSSRCGSSAGAPARTPSRPRPRSSTRRSSPRRPGHLRRPVAAVRGLERRVGGRARQDAGMQLSAWPSAVHPWPVVRDLALHAESRGYHGVWVMDHFMDNTAAGRRPRPRGVLASSPPWPRSCRGSGWARWWPATSTATRRSWPTRPPPSTSSATAASSSAWAPGGRRTSTRSTASTC